MSLEKRLGEVIPEYDGNCSANMHWNEEALNGFVVASDLRTTIRIKAGQATSGRNYIQIGDTLAWRDAIDLRNLFRSSVRENGADLAETTQSNHFATAELYLNQHLITEDIKRKKEGFSNQFFVNEVNDLSKRGLVKILAREKLGQLITSGSLFAAEYVMASIIMAAGTGLAYLGVNGIINRPPFPQYPLSLNIGSIGSYLGPAAYRMGTAIMGTIGLAVDYGAIRFPGYVSKELYRDMIEDLKHPYFQSVRDISNPLKPIKDFMAGCVYLQTRGKTLVKCK